MAKNKLGLLLELETDKEENLRINYVQAQQNFISNQQKLQGLNDFRLEYSQQLHNKAQQGMSCENIKQFNSFINKIEEAINQQATTVRTAKQVEEQRRQLWLTQQAKTKAIEKLIEKKTIEMQVKENKAEQKMLDEFATNIFMRRIAN